MRQIETHKVNGVNDGLQIEVLDGPGPGGASHEYLVTVQPQDATADKPESKSWQIGFQNGGIAQVGTNGLTHEALLAIVIDRLQSFQAGEFKCRENAIALTHLEDAMHWLQHRTRARLARGVEGKVVQ